MFSNMPAQDAYDFVWSGLLEARVYTILSEKCIKQLKITNAKYKSYGSRSASSKRTYCN